jgi:hypothetical protein
MKDFIKQTLVELYKTCSTDSFGQVHISNHQPCLFGDKAKDVENYCNENPGVLKFSTYGGSLGVYTAFTICDKEIREACSAALSKNKNYINNINSW